MTDRKKVIRELQSAYDINAIDESMVITYNWVVRDAAELLREQPPARLMTLEEVKKLPPDTDVYVENATFDDGPRYLLAATKEGVGGTNGVSFFYFTRLWRDYNKLPYGWRVWTARPDNEYRRAVEWDA